MQRVADEAQYVLALLYRTRDNLSANPELFDPGAEERIDEAISRVQAVLRSTRSLLAAEKNVKAA